MGLSKNISKSTVRGHWLGITYLCFHLFYKRLGSGSDNINIIIWECDEFTGERSLKAQPDTINHLTIDNNGKYLSYWSSDLSIKVWNFDILIKFIIFLYIKYITNNIKNYLKNMQIY